MQWFAQAPSNIALIKYMGKQDEGTNVPINASLSYTLDNLVTTVVLEKHPGKQDFWEELTIPGAKKFILSPAGQQRFLNHLAFLKKTFRYDGSFIVRSTNNFPHSSGLASSASSFAALTKCAILALSELTDKPAPNTTEQAKLSQVGSGSSCRSFFSPWTLWTPDTTEAISLPQEKLIHQVIVVSHEEKNVPSSEAHQRIRTSNQFSSRAQRAQTNLKALLQALTDNDWETAYHVCWKEFQDMHQLFSSSNPSFTYFTESALSILDQLKQFWEENGDGPIVTMDAGPNIHLLYRSDQAHLAHQFKQHHLVGNYDVL